MPNNPQQPNKSDNKPKGFGIRIQIPDLGQSSISETEAALVEKIFLYNILANKSEVEDIQDYYISLVEEAVDEYIRQKYK
jgi:hypothetical protein